MKHYIGIFCTHKNHIDIAPFVIDYWKRINCHVYIFDNASTDGSLENFNKYDFITVYDMSSLTGGQLNDIINARLKNEFWQQFRNEYDYIINCDFDECPYCDDWDSVLDALDNINACLIHPKFCNMVDDEIKEYDKKNNYYIIS